LVSEWDEDDVVPFKWNWFPSRWYLFDYPGRAAFLMSLFGSISILFSGKSRRGEITYFVFVRACRSAYIYLKKRHNFNISAEKSLCFIAIFGIISYLYFDGHQNLKNRNLL
jgi:hypothetical protein